MGKLDVSQATEEQKREILKYATDNRKFEIGMFWQRSLFFWGFLSVAFVAYASLLSANERDMRIVVACFGTICSFAWMLQNVGSKYWQDAWEQKVEAVEQDVLGCNLFRNIEPRLKKGIFGARRYSVSGLVIALSTFTFAIWIGLLITALPLVQISWLVQNAPLSVPVLMPMFSILFLLIVWRSCRRPT